MTETDNFSALATQHVLGDDRIPGIVAEFAGDCTADLVWRNDLGGLTFRIDDRFVKWNPHRTGIDLERERAGLQWIEGRHPAPRVIASGSNDEAQWLVTKAVPGDSAVGDEWRARRTEAIRAIATGLRAIHAVPIDDFPSDWPQEVWVGRETESIGPRPSVGLPVLLHGDACAPNTLISSAGEWTGHVDFGDLTVGDRWADLAIASRSLDWNFGEGYQDELFGAYGIEPDEERIRYYRTLSDVES